ncbi:hypothetical protein BC940DRAFT_316625 [Gongronella butleri]|nr:hypothetical protein BC940DRAFT_316625 [Gongronella butleri]
MLPSKALKSQEHLQQQHDDEVQQDPPPSYADTVATPSSPYANAYPTNINAFHQRTPTAPPESLLPRPSTSSSSPPLHDNHYLQATASPYYYGATPASSGYPNVADADIETPSERQPLLGTSPTAPPPPPPPASTAIPPPPSSSDPPDHPANGFNGSILPKWRAHAAKAWEKVPIWRWTTRRACIALLLVILVAIVLGIVTDDEMVGHPSPPSLPGTINMRSPYPLLPSYRHYKDGDDFSDLAPSQLTYIGLDFTSHRGNIHLTTTDDPVSWISFQTGSQPEGMLLRTDHLSMNTSHADFTIHYGGGGGSWFDALTAVVHLCEHDRIDAQIAIATDSMNIHIPSYDSVKDVKIVGRGPDVNFISNGNGWEGRRLDIRMIGDNQQMASQKLNASDSIYLEVVGIAGGKFDIMKDITAGNAIHMRSENGHIVTFDNAALHADHVELITTNSAIEVRNIEARKSCTLRTENGKIDARFAPTTISDELRVVTANAHIELSVPGLVQKAHIASNTGSIAMHASKKYQGAFDVQSSLGSAHFEDRDPNTRVIIDVNDKHMIQGRRGTQRSNASIGLQSFAGASYLVFDQ